jgi:hypothetical protein
MPGIITTALIGLAHICSAVKPSLARKSGGVAMTHASLRTTVPRPVGAKSTYSTKLTPSRLLPYQKIKTPGQCWRACGRLPGASVPFYAASCY